MHIQKKIPANIDYLLLVPALLTLFTPSDLLKIGCIALVGFIRFTLVLFYSRKLHNYQLSLLIIMLYLVLYGCIQSLLVQNLLPNIIAYIILGFYVFFYVFTAPHTSPKVLNNLFRLFCYIVYFQAILVIITGFGHKFKPGDWYVGTTGGAHNSGILLYIVLIKKIYDYFFYKQKGINKLILLGILGFAAWLTDTNQFLIALTLSFIYINYINIRKLFKVKYLIILSALIGFFYVYLIVTNFIILFESKYQNLNNTPKLKGYYSLYEFYSEEPIYLIAGTGIGGYSSRAAVSLASAKYLAKPTGRKIPVENTSIFTKKYFSKYYSPTYWANLEKVGVTGTFYTPFATIISIIAEYGLIGIFFLVIIVLQLKKILERLKSYDLIFYKYIGTLMLAYFVTFFYDNWLEHPDALFPSLLILMLGIHAAIDAENQNHSHENK